MIVTSLYCAQGLEVSDSAHSRDYLVNLRIILGKSYSANECILSDMPLLNSNNLDNYKYCTSDKYYLSNNDIFHCANRRGWALP